MKVVFYLKLFLLFFCISLKGCSPFTASQIPLISFARLAGERIQAEKNNGSGADQFPKKEKVKTPQEQLQEVLQSQLPGYHVNQKDVEDIARRHRYFMQEQLHFVARSINPDEFADNIEYQRNETELAAFMAISSGNVDFVKKQMAITTQMKDEGWKKLQSVPVAGDIAYRNPALSPELVGIFKHRWGLMGINFDNVHCDVDNSVPSLGVSMRCGMYYERELCGKERLPVVKKFFNASFWLLINPQYVSRFQQSPMYAHHQASHEGKHLFYGDYVVLNVLLGGPLKNQKGLQEVVNFRRLQEYAASVPLRGDGLGSIFQLISYEDQLAKEYLTIGQQCTGDGIHPQSDSVVRVGQSLLNYLERKEDDDVGQGLGHVIQPEFSHNGRIKLYN